MIFGPQEEAFLGVHAPFISLPRSRLCFLRNGSLVIRVCSLVLHFSPFPPFSFSFSHQSLSRLCSQVLLSLFSSHMFSFTNFSFLSSHMYSFTHFFHFYAPTFYFHFSALTCFLLHIFPFLSSHVLSLSRLSALPILNPCPLSFYCRAYCWRLQLIFSSLRNTSMVSKSLLTRLISCTPSKIGRISACTRHHCAN